MRTRNSERPLLDFQSYQDDAWYTMRPSLLNKQTIILKYLDFPEHDESYKVQDFRTPGEAEEFERRLRPACVPLQDTDCNKMALTWKVCCSLTTIGDGGEDLKFYDGVISSIRRKRHDQEKENPCECSFRVLWKEGPKAGSTESMDIGRMCKIVKGSPRKYDLHLRDFLSMLPSNKGKRSLMTAKKRITKKRKFLE